MLNVTASRMKSPPLSEILKSCSSPCMGDFNLDLLQFNHYRLTQEFVDTLFSHAFIPLFPNPTRLTSFSATLIDNIFTNNLSPSCLDGIVLNDLFHQLPVFAYFSRKTLTTDGENNVLIRKITEKKNCVNSTKTFQTHAPWTGPHFLMKISIWLTIILQKCDEYS